MHKKLEAELISIAHGILQMKNRDDVKALHEKAHAIYEKLSVLRFLDYYQQTTPNATETKEELLEIIAKSAENKERLEKEAKDKMIISEVKKVLSEEIKKINSTPKTETKPKEVVNKEKLVSAVKEVIQEETPKSQPVKPTPKVAKEKVVVKNDEPTLIVKELPKENTIQEESDDVFSKPISKVIQKEKITEEPKIKEAAPVVETPKMEAPKVEKPQIETPKPTEAAKPKTEAELVREQLEAIRKQAEQQRKDFEIAKQKAKENPQKAREEAEAEKARILEEKRKQQAELQRQEELKRAQELRLQQEAQLRKAQELKLKQQQEEELRKAQALKLQQQKLEEEKRKAQELAFKEQQAKEAQKKTLEEELRNSVSVDVTSEMFENPEKLGSLDQRKSLNDRLVKNTVQIGLNDRIAFVKHLFDNSQEDFNRVLSQLNTLKSEREAKYFITKMVKPDYNWTDKEQYEERLMTLIERRFV
ncbi:hypothetical protein [Aureivirga marina]|uniref:hypothetical protein n=1 Tax=Aureivirga marina TaxID=1182451 RepID=UPI0018CAF19C|nr:hypothetical protein [Aureivirga marina]